MATLRPFRGLRFSGAAGPLSEVVAPPYDVISADEREQLAGQNAYNMVHLTLPEQNADDRSKYVKYMRSASRLAEWRRDGLLARDESPSLYRYLQTFTAPGFEGEIVRQSLIATIKVEPYDRGVVLPHEQTFPKHKEDRLRILEATRAHLECIYGLFEDDGGQVLAAIGSASADRFADVTTSDGVRHVVERIEDPTSLNELVNLLADKRVWIADGHHRYETALNFRGLQPPSESLIAEDFMMMALSSISDPGLIVLPTHRIVPNLPIATQALDEAFGRFFHVRKVANGHLLHEISALHRPDTRAFGVALPGGTGLLLSLDRPQDALEWIDGPESERLKLLDVTLLHRVIFEKCLNLTGNEFFNYTRDPNEALEAVELGAGASFLMNPPTVDDMRWIALGGEKMPQKSTYYYPKILSGLVLWALEDFNG